MDAYPRIAELFAQAAEIEPTEIHRDSRLRSFDNVDSLDLAEFYMTVEEEYDVELPDHVCACFDTIGDVAKRVEEARNGG